MRRSRRTACTLSLLAMALPPASAAEAGSATHDFKIVAVQTVPRDCAYVGGEKVCPKACEIRTSLQNLSKVERPDLEVTLAYKSSPDDGADSDKVLRFGFPTLAAGRAAEAVDHAPRTLCSAIVLGDVAVSCLGTPDACADHLALAVASHAAPTLESHAVEVPAPEK